MRKLLIVEDEKLIRKGIIAIASRAGIDIEEIIECKNGLEALEVVKSQKIDVMITDIRMPKMDGVALVKEVQKLSTMPKIVVISGYDDFSYAVEMLRCGVKEYLLKPINREDITRTIKQLDEEISLEEQRSETRIKSLYEQIRYMLLHRELGDKELELIQEQFQECYDSTDYVMVCTNYQVNKKIVSNQVSFFTDINGHNLLLIRPEYVKCYIEENLPDCLVGISRIYSGIGQIHAAVDEAVAMRTKHYCRQKKDMPALAEHEPISHREIDRFIQLIGTARLEETDRFFVNLIQRTKRCEIGADVFADLMNQIVTKIMHTYAGIITSEAIQVRLLSNVYNYTDIDEYYAQFSKVIAIINQKLANEYDDYRNRVKIEQAVQFIEINYHKDINMAIVSNHISMNYSVFSLTFKEYTGHNFVNYLKDVRLKEAKKLLDATDNKINEISSAVGYEDEKHFMKTFKTAYGVTPSEYRKNMQMGKH